VLNGGVTEKPGWRGAVSAWCASLRKSESYLNFDVHLVEEEKREQGDYAIVFSTAGSVRHDLDPSLAADDGCQLPRDPATGLPGVQRATPDPTLKTAQSLGDQLWKALFGGRILGCFQREYQQARARGKRIRVRLWLARAPELARRPWELLFDASQNKFLLHDPHVSLVRYLEHPELCERPSVKLPLHVLVAMAVPGDRPSLAVEEELRWIRAALAGLLKAKRVTLEVLRDATLEEIEEHLRSGIFHVFHFIGHGGGGALLLEDGRRRADLLEGRDLGVLLRSHPSLRLVVLNACEGGLADRSDAFAGVAQALVREGVPAVVAMQSEISDRASLLFTRRFYQELAEGATVDRAVADARRTMYVRQFRLAWAAPVLFTRGFEGPIVAPRCPAAALLTSFLAALGLALALAVPEGSWHSWYCKLLKDPPRPPKPVRVDAEECPSPPGLDIPFVRIEPQSFRMGSDKGPKEVRPEHEITLTEPFCISVFEVTEKNWRDVMGSQSGSIRGDDYPITEVNWDDSNNFTRQLNLLGFPGNYRLPTEAQLELAGREGTDAGTRPASGRRVANCKGTGWGDCWLDLAPVGQFEANRWGLYDVVGNAGEWVADWYDLYDPFATKDPDGPSSGTGKVWRGGSYDSAGGTCTTLARTGRDPTRRNKDTSFRIVRDPVSAAVPASDAPAGGTKTP
jgi:formylglycine-generating enzyme required for sulfatase activity